MIALLRRWSVGWDINKSTPEDKSSSQFQKKHILSFTNNLNQFFMLKKITASRMILDEETQRKTGKAYTVVFDPEVGVKKIISICAVEQFQRTSIVIDITLYETQFNDADAFIDAMFPWDELAWEPYVEKPEEQIRDQFFHMAKAIVTKHAKLLRH
jgi:hypothetical protein